MDVLQGRYLKSIESKGGPLKGLTIETAEGVQSIYLPKPLRSIAQQELVPGDMVRVWATPAKLKRKKGSKTLKVKAPQPQVLLAAAFIPLVPKAKVVSPINKAKLNKAKLKQAESKKAKSQKPKSQKGKAKKTKSKKTKSKKTKSLTVQLCQKKNCCKRGGTQLWKAFEAVTESQGPFTLESVGCLGGCKRGPNIRFLPNNVKHYHVQPGEVTQLLQRYRG